MVHLLIDSSTIKAGQVALTVGQRFFDFFRSNQYLKIEWTSSDYKKEKWLWWTTLEQGEKITLELRGKSAFCEAVLNHLSHRSLIMRNGMNLDAGNMMQSVKRIS